MLDIAQSECEHNSLCQVLSLQEERDIAIEDKRKDTNELGTCVLNLTTYTTTFYQAFPHVHVHVVYIRMLTIIKLQSIVPFYPEKEVAELKIQLTNLQRMLSTYYSDEDYHALEAEIEM